MTAPAANIQLAATGRRHGILLQKPRFDAPGSIMKLSHVLVIEVQRITTRSPEVRTTQETEEIYAVAPFN
jgi:hypothetical protein